MPTLVTGATGFVGSAVVRALLRVGEEVRVLVRPGSDLSNLEGLKNVETVPGEMRDPSSLRSALKGCRRLYHVAALYSLWLPNPSEIYETNVMGTRNLMKAALEMGVERVVHTSTVGAVVLPKEGGPGNEGTSLSLQEIVGHYKRSKFLAEQEVRDLIPKGLPAVIVNPSAPIGPRDVKPTPTGQMIVDFLKGRMWAYLETGLNLIDVGDVAEGHLLAAEKGRVGERYILGHRNLFLREIFGILARISGRRAPILRIPYSMVLPLAYISTEISNRVTHRPPRIPLEGVRMAKRPMFFDSTKAVHELGLPQRSVEGALEQSVVWFREHGYV
jgi:dihydroflavonol-4-reductase